MPAAPDQTRLVEAAMALRSTAPQLWDNFVSALQIYSDAMNAQMVSCSPEMLPRAQGMAIAVAEITTVMREAPSMHQKIQDFRRKQASHGRPASSI